MKGKQLQRGIQHYLWPPYVHMQMRTLKQVHTWAHVHTHIQTHTIYIYTNKYIIFLFLNYASREDSRKLLKFNKELFEELSILCSSSLDDLSSQ